MFRKRWGEWAWNLPTLERSICSNNRLIMRFYDEGDNILVFGFLRGAFTLNSLHVTRGGSRDGSGQDKRCAPRVQGCLVQAKVHYIRLDDTVSSVANFVKRPKSLPEVSGTSEHIRSLCCLLMGDNWSWNRLFSFRYSLWVVMVTLAVTVHWNGWLKDSTAYNEKKCSTYFQPKFQCLSEKLFRKLTKSQIPLLE